MEIIKHINNLLKNNSSSLLYEEILFLLKNKINSNNFYLVTISSGGKLYRVRKNEDNKKFYNVKNLSYPPPKYISYFNRVNRPGQSMFYSSEYCPMTSIELLYDFIEATEINNIFLFTYSEWEIIENLNLLVLAFPEKEFTNGLNIKKDFDKWVNLKNKDFKTKINNQYELVYYYFNKIAKNNNIYKVTSAISNIANLYHNDIDGFLYPSVANGNGYNIALNPFVINKQKVIIKKIWMKEWKKTNVDSAFYKTINIKANIENNKIKWE